MMEEVYSYSRGQCLIISNTVIKDTKMMGNIVAGEFMYAYELVKEERVVAKICLI